jgi:uncharacterized protein
MTRTTKQSLLALSAGLLFGVGLTLAGMTRPSKVIGFLDFAGDWDPSLVLVMLGAIAVHVIAYRTIRGSAAPLFADEYSLPTRRTIDARLVIGSALFGVGWGLAGYCPGPALVSLGSGSVQAVVFVPAMLLGMFAADKLAAARERVARRDSPTAASGTDAARGAS